MPLFSPKFVLRGSRRYVHGPDMYSAVASGLADMGLADTVASFSMNIRASTHNYMDLFIGVPGEPAQRFERGVADFRCSTPAGTVTGWLIETDHSISESVPYPEQEIMAAATITGRSIELQPLGRAAVATPVQAITAVCKALHQLHMPPGELQWMIVRLTLDKLLASELAESIHLRLISGDALTRSNFKCGSCNGDIYFAKGKP